MTLFAPLVSFVSTHGSCLTSPRAGAAATTAFGRIATTTTMSSLHASLYVGAGKMADYSAAAISFFTSIRIPAALIAGSSLSNMFTDAGLVVDQAENDSDRNGGGISPIQNRVTVLYHIFALLAFLLSINVVLTATATSTSMLLGMKNPMAHSPYELLRRELDWQFTSTRWSFFMALFSFLTSVCGRLLVEFRLLERRRFRTASFLTSSMLSLMLHYLSMANRSLQSWPHMGAMTVDLFKLILQQARQSPIEAASLACANLALIMGIWAWVKTKGFSRLDLDDKGTN